MFDNFKCWLCNSWSFDQVIVIEGHGMYATTMKRRYHQKCLEKILGNPEKFEHLIVDRAIEIGDKILEDRQRKIAHEEFMSQRRSEQVKIIGELQVKLLGTPKK